MSDPRKPTSRKPTYSSLQAGRAISALMVVLSHAATLFGEDPRYWHRAWLTYRIAGLALSIEYFFVLSGAVILLAHYRDIGHPSSIPAYLWKRFRHVYPLYWIVLTVFVVTYPLHPALHEPWRTDPWVIVSGYFLVFLNTLQVNLAVAWTLFHEILFYLGFAVLLANRLAGRIILAVWFILSIVTMVHPWSLFGAYYLFAPLHIFFAFGMAAAWLLVTRKISHAGWIAALGTCLFVGAAVAASIAGDVSMTMHFVGGTGATLLLFSSVRLEQQGRLSIPRSLRFMGDASYSLYLVHYPVMMLAAPVLFRVWQHHPVPLLIPFLALFGLGAASGPLVHILVERPLLRALPR